MLTHFGVDSLHAQWQESFVCIGTFDGVHLGHQELIKAAVRKAQKAESPSVLLTFDRHPSAILAPERCPPAISTLDQNLAAIEGLGISVTIVLAFDESLAAMSAEDFLSSILIESLKTKELIIGHDFAFGHNRVGTPEWIQSHIVTTVIPPVIIEGERVSSSKIRELIAQGDLQKAEQLLGRPFALEGVVVGGQKLGHKLGFPTINLARSSIMVTPKNGIYSGLCQTPYGEYKAAISIGVRPSVDGKNHTVEAFLIDYPGQSLYGQTVELKFHKWLREERRFETLDALKNQIEKDVCQTVELLANV